MLRVTFLMPPEKYPPDPPFVPDIDNFLKGFQDALEETIFKYTCGGDSCIAHLEASKIRVKSPSEAGAQLEVLPHIVA